MLERLLLQAERVQPEVIAWRRHLHRYPELSFEEHRTAIYIEETLRGFGRLEVSRPTPTSVMGRLRGPRPGRILAIRADIDALPIQETSGVPFTSEHEGVMHACGHDGHTAMALGVARVLTQLWDELNWAGEVRFLFQHAEELPPGGADDMIAAGVMDGVDWVIGAHLQSPVETGKVGVCDGAMLASPDTFHLTVEGKGGHAAEPHKTVDAIAIGAQLVANLQHLASRMTDPMQPLVVSVTRFIGGHTHNVIPGSVEMSGTVRCMSPELRAEIPQRMEQLIRGITEAHGATYSFRYLHGYRPLVNDSGFTSLVRETIVELQGADALYAIQPSMSADDFSAFLERAPGTYFNIGAGNREQGIVHPHHHPQFAIDERALGIGIRIYLGVAAKLLGN